MFRLFLAMTVVASLFGCKSPRPLPLSAPRTCQEIRGAYCIEAVGLTIEIHPVSNAVTRLVIYEPEWRDTPLTIVEPGTCRVSMSDTVQVISFDGAAQPNRLRLRLAKSGSCDLEISTADAGPGRLGWGLSTALTEIRACQRKLCEGPVIGRLIRPNIDK